MNYWWVNHRQTFKQEFGGGYMWSPKTNKNGGKSHFYDNMTRVKAGDIVYSFAYGQIQAVGVVMSGASSYRKPEEFGKTGDNWENEGWYVSVKFERYGKPFRPKDKMDVIAPLLPAKYPPIQANGNGNQAAYLSLVSKQLASNLNALIGENSLINRLRDDQAEHELIKSENITETEKEQLVKARRGQGRFRSNVERI